MTSRTIATAVDDCDGLIDFELGAFDEVAEVRLEERRVSVPRVRGVGNRMVLRCGLAQCVDENPEQPHPVAVVGSAGLTRGERLRAGCRPLRSEGRAYQDGS